jgi:hypothetical protein
MALLEPVNFGPSIRGGWCEHCLLPSVWTQTIVGLNPCTLDEVGRFEATKCDECGCRTARQLSGARTEIRLI